MRIAHEKAKELDKAGEGGVPGEDIDLTVQLRPVTMEDFREARKKVRCQDVRVYMCCVRGTFGTVILVSGTGTVICNGGAVLGLIDFGGLLGLIEISPKLTPEIPQSGFLHTKSCTKVKTEGIRGG